MTDLVRHTHPVPSTLERTRLDTRVAALRLANWSIEQIAEELDLDREEVYRSWRRANALAKRELAEIAKDCLIRDLQALDAMAMSVWEDAIDGDKEAQDQILKFMDRRAKWLDYADGKDQTAAVSITITPKV